MAQDIKLYPLTADVSDTLGASKSKFKSKADLDLDRNQLNRDLNETSHNAEATFGHSTTLRKPQRAQHVVSIKEGQDSCSLHEVLPSPPPEPLDDEESSGFARSPDEDLEFPEGGAEAYLVVFGSFSALTVTFGLMNTIGVIQAYVSEHILQSATETQVGWIYSVFFFFAFGGGIYAGPIFDFNGARIPMFVGSVLIVAGLLASANSKTVWQFVLSFGVVVGIGESFLMNCCISCVSHYFLKRRATALGVCSISGSLGGVAWPLMLRALFPKIGYVWTIRILAFISAVLLGIGCVFVKHRITKKLDEGHKKIDIVKNSFVVKDLVTDKVFFCLTVAIIMSEFCLIMALTYMSSYTIAQGYSESNAFLVTIACNCVGIAGRYLPNHAADRYGNMNVMIVCATMCTILILVIWLPFGKDLKCMFAFACLFGFFSSSTLSLTPVCCGQISKTEDFGKRYGTVYFLVGFGNLIALPIGGAIIGSSSSGWNHMIIFTGVVEAVSAMFWVLTRYYIAGTRMVKV